MPAPLAPMTHDLEVDPPAAHDVTPSDDEKGPLVADDLLVEDVSIDGMCGVY